MANEKLAAALRDRAASEQQIYRDRLYAMPTKEALEHAFEYAMRENILMALESPKLEDIQIRALLSSPTPLKDIFSHYDNHDFSLMVGIRKSIAELADDTVTQWRELPVYKYPGAYAREHEELELYRASHKANIACKEAIEAAVNGHYSGYCLDTKAAVREVVEQFGYERMLYVLAVTVKKKEWDGRISSGNKNWAQTVPVFEDMDGFGHNRNTAFVVDKCHSSLTDMFVTEARHEYLLTLPLTKEDIRAEALNILCKFQSLQEPNSPSGTHFMAQVSPDFLARANTKDRSRLMTLLPFRSLALSELNDRKGIYALISKDEDRTQPLRRGRSSVRTKLQSEASAPKRRASGKKKAQER